MIHLSLDLRDQPTHLVFTTSKYTDRYNELGGKNTVEFDLAKTELIYFTTSKEAESRPLLLPNRELVQPKELVR